MEGDWTQALGRMPSALIAGQQCAEVAALTGVGLVRKVSTRDQTGTRRHGWFPSPMLIVRL